jgi:hypothetical protein
VGSPFTLNMRTLLLAIAVIFILGGGAAIMRPRLSPEVFHPRSGVTEVGSKRQAVIYGFVSLGLGGATLFAGVSWKKWAGASE